MSLYLWSVETPHPWKPLFSGISLLNKQKERFAHCEDEGNYFKFELIVSADWLSFRSNISLFSWQPD